MIKNLPKKLKSLRTKYGYSQKQVADKLNVSPSIISGYETGERTPSTDTLISLSKLYGCSIDYLLGNEFSEPPIIFDTEGLTDKQIDAIRILIESMKDR